MQQKITEYEEQLEALLNKCSSLEKQKSRLQSEVEVLIMDLEKATTHAQVGDRPKGLIRSNYLKRLFVLLITNHPLSLA